MDNTVAIILMIWFACMLAAGGIASDRGGSAYAGAFVGFLLGPLGLIVALFMGDKEGRERLALRYGDMKKCPDCAELVKPDARVCRYCRHEFSAGAAA